MTDQPAATPPCPFLPVPALDQTLDRYLEAVRSLQTAQEHARTRTQVEAYRIGKGPHDQAGLVEYARTQNLHGNSWLGDLWLAEYLRAREPLQLTSNVGFQLAWPEDDQPGGSGVARAADFAQRMAAVHLQYLRGEMPPDFNARGQRISECQRRFLAGGMRRPRPGEDVFEDASQAPGDRHIVVLRGGRAYKVPVSDGAGRPLPAAALQEAFQQIITETAGSDQAGPGELPFTAMSHLGSEVLAPLVKEMLADPANQDTCHALRDALFVLDLADSPAVEGTEAALRDLTFGTGSAYAYKPISYQFGLEDGFVGAHVEHSIVDGATIAETVKKARALRPDTRPVRDIPVVKPLTWQMDAAQREPVEAQLQDVQDAAAELQVRVVTVPFAADPQLRLSQDALMQWVILAAQLAAWGEVRSTYEAVDMREYQAGRTESFRPHTDAAVELARALLDGSATAVQLQAAALAHSALVRAAKTGTGIERHLFALKKVAEQSGGELPGLFAGGGYQALTDNFLSTSSLGGAEFVQRFAFAPVREGGIGVNYTRVPEGYEFCLTYSAADGGAQRADKFAGGLARAAEALQAFLQDQGPAS